MRCAGRPTFSTDLARSRKRVGPPEDPAGLGIESCQPPAYPVLTAGNAAIDHAVVIEWGTGNAIAITPIFDRCLPHFLAGLHVKGNNVGVKLSKENLALAH